MQIPYDRLDPETLQRVIEEYISREGTDYGHSTDILVKTDQILRKLKSGEALLCFDENSETCQIMSREAYRFLGNDRAQVRESLSDRTEWDL